MTYDEIQYLTFRFWTMLLLALSFKWSLAYTYLILDK